MLRLTLILLVAIYAVMVLYGDAPEEVVLAEESAAPPATRSPGTGALRQAEDGTIILQTGTGERVRIDAIVDPNEPTEQEGVRAVTPTQITPDTGGDLLGIPAETVEVEPAPEPAAEPEPTPPAVAAAEEDTAPDPVTEPAPDPQADAVAAAVDEALAEVLGETAEVAPVPRPEPEPATQSPDATPVLFQVDGDRVNFRAGPSTDNAILDTLTRGETLELIEEAPDGWAHLRVVATGLEGYMSGDFLTPAN